MSNAISKACKVIERVMMSSHFFVNHSFMFLQKRQLTCTLEMYFPQQLLEQNDFIAT